MTIAPEPGGDFSWVGLLTPDVAGARRFYGELFGWTVRGGGTNDAQPYDVMGLRGEDVALAYEVAEWQRALGAPTNWATFVSVSDIRTTASRAAGLGGSVAIPPYEAAGAARIAVVTDPGGARLSLWQPLSQRSPHRGGAVGTCCWNELVTGEIDTVSRFYSELFGWDVQRKPSGYRVVTHRSIAQGGIRAHDGRDGARSHWLPYFRVANLGDALERCAAAGGAVADTSLGRPAAVLRDRGGAAFGVCARMPAGSRGAPARAGRTPGNGA